MKKVIALVLATITMVSLLTYTVAENGLLTTTAALTNSEQILPGSEHGLPSSEHVVSFKIKDYSYDGELIKGKVVSTGAPLEGKYLNVRYTLFLEGNNYAQGSQVVAEDGTFEITAVGNIEHITLVVFSFTKLSDKTTHTTYSGSAVEFDVAL